MSQKHPTDVPLIDTLHLRLSALRIRVNSIIDRRVVNPDAEWPQLVDDMCAYSLTTSATPTDILRHFYSIRRQAICENLNETENVKQHIAKALVLFVRTLYMSQILFPKRLADALAKLKDRPLIHQNDVRALPELELSIYERWIAQELRNYTPRPRHDELQKPEFDKIMKSWARKSLDLLLSGMKTALSREKSFQETLELRRDIFLAWPLTGKRLPGLDPSEVADEFRELLNEQLIRIIRREVSDVRNVVSSLSELLETTGTQTTTSLWESSLNMASSKGAVAFRKKVLSTYHGSDENTSAVVRLFESWVLKMNSIFKWVHEMRSMRWDDDITEDVDNLEIDLRQGALNDDDPRDLEGVLKDALLSTFTRLREELENLIRHTLEADSCTPAKVLVLLRFLRDISLLSVSPREGSKFGFISPKLSGALVSPLLKRLAHFVASLPLANFRSDVAGLLRQKKVASRILWEGNPPLPVQPSLPTFKLLDSLTTEMTTMGLDIWGSGAVQALKMHVEEKCCSLLEELLSKFAENPGPPTTQNSISNVSADGEDEDESQAPEELSQTDGVQIDMIYQLLYDILYLRWVLQTHGEEAFSFDHTISGLTKIIPVEQSIVERLQKSAADYWKRSYLLFALIARI